MSESKMIPRALKSRTNASLSTETPPFLRKITLERARDLYLFKTEFTNVQYEELFLEDTELALVESSPRRSVSHRYTPLKSPGNRH
ncbi:hypothetical protein KSP40_PGU001304 [Platanthera guangdongensis]|uniref:Uncharacterized protein n=1 Tax=Platanthera guangdongensis TaxID=2320717 RepID=A0ABR2LFR0_9ASPA